MEQENKKELECCKINHLIRKKKFTTNPLWYYNISIMVVYDERETAYNNNQFMAAGIIIPN